MIVIIDYGMGNLRSVEKSLQRLNANALVSSAIADIERADKLILPGVGHFANGMAKLKAQKLIEPLTEKVVKDKTPILGICLGIQLFTKHSEEGDVNGLGWVEARTVRFNFPGADPRLKIPHMGWNSVAFKKESKLAGSITPEDSFYFVHSYHVQCANSEDILCQTRYGIDFVSGIEHDNIFGVQFHPEKSHGSGLKFLNNFLAQV
jgi:imidazole glycerol-phosphate synthase subunit HisH